MGAYYRRKIKSTKRDGLAQYDAQGKQVTRKNFMVDKVSPDPASVGVRG